VFKIFKILKLFYFIIKWAKMILLLQFSLSPSVWWLYIQSVINTDFMNGCINVIPRIFIYLIMDSPVC